METLAGSQGDERPRIKRVHGRLYQVFLTFHSPNQILRSVRLLVLAGVRVDEVLAAVKDDELVVVTVLTKFCCDLELDTTRRELRPEAKLRSTSPPAGVNADADTEDIVVVACEGGE